MVLRSLVGTFYRIPKVLFTDPGLRNISAEAKILYGLLLDRMGLSAANGWLDDQGRVFIIYTIEEMMEQLGCAEQKTAKLIFWVSPAEEAMIQARMAQVGTKSLSAFLRKMALDGIIINVKIPELQEIISLLRRCSNNLNQIARQVNVTGRLYETEMEQMLQYQEQSWQAMNELLAKLAKLK